MELSALFREWIPHNKLEDSFPSMITIILETDKTGSFNWKKGCFRRKMKFFQESEDFTGNQETWEILWET